MPRSLVILAFVCLALAATFARGQDEKASTPMPKINNEALDKLGWKLASQAYTFRSLTLFDTIDTLNRLGIRYIEMYPGQKFSKENPAKADHNMSDEMIDQLKQKLEGANVTAINYGVVDLPNDEAKSRKVFDFAKKLNLKTIVSEPPQDALPLVDKLAGEYQINVAIHNHPAPSRYWDCATVLLALKDRSERIGACADIGHWVRSGLSSPGCLKNLEGHVLSLHVKDIDENKHDVVWGTGKVDVAGCLKELKRQGAKPILSVEYETGSGEELVANVAKSLEYFSDQVTKLADE